MHQESLDIGAIDLDQFEGEKSSGSSKLDQQSWWGSAANWMKKKYFNGAHLLDLALNDQKSDDISLFGMRFKSNEEAKILYSSILWFTYRENLKFYRIKKEFTIKSDVGWGCMVRVGQMMLAHCLRLVIGTQYFDDAAEISKILKEFINEDGKYSVEKIAQKAYEMFGLKPGEWYSPSHIAHVLCSLQNQNKESKLKVMVFDNEFEWSKAIDFLDEKCPKNGKKFGTVKQQKENILRAKIDPGLIIILFRIGMKAPEPDLLSVVIKFIKQERNCIGILGGRPGKAHYMFGTSQKSFIYLDPHCVKDTNEIDSFFCHNMFSINHENIDPSMGLCFFVRNAAELLHLYDKFDEQKKALPFYSYSKSEIPLMVQKEELEEGFQQLKIQERNNRL